MQEQHCQLQDTLNALAMLPTARLLSTQHLTSIEKTCEIEYTVMLFG
jgi:hypothetical protein